MRISRREFFGAALAAGVAAAQEEGGGLPAAAPPTRQANVEKLFKAPDNHPNALEAAADGLWIGDQVSERAFRVDWKTGKVLHEVQTESHNTSGIAVGGGHLWLGANGGVSGRRPARPTDRPFGEVLQADLKTGKTIKAYRPVWGGGVHGITYAQQTLWITALSITALSEVDPKDFRVLRQIPLRHGRAHGLDLAGGVVWCLFAGERTVHKLDPDTGKVLEVVQISEQDPDPHGMCIHDGYMYYGDAGLTATFPGSAPGYVCRFKL
jgi:streptogramin lyase